MAFSILRLKIEGRGYIYDGNTGWSIDFFGNGVTVPVDWDFFDESVWQEAEDRLDGYHGAGSGCGMQKRQW